MTITQLRDLTEIQTSPRDLDLLNKTLYKFELSFSGMSRTISFDWGELNLDTQSLECLQKSGAKISALPIFSQLKKYVSELEKKRRDIQRKTIYCQAERVVTEKNLSTVFAETNELILLAEESREKLRQEYQAGLDDFKQRIKDLLSTPAFKLSPLEVKAKVETIAGASFIDYREIDDFLKVKITAKKIPALGEQLETQTEEARIFAALQVAKHQAEEAKQAFKHKQGNEREELIALRETVYADVQQEVGAILAETIETIDTFEEDKSNTLAKKRIKKFLQRLEVLVEFDTNGSLLQAQEALIATDNCFTEHTNQIVENFEAKRKECLAQVKQASQAVEQAQTPKLRTHKLSF